MPRAGSASAEPTVVPRPSSDHCAPRPGVPAAAEESFDPAVSSALSTIEFECASYLPRLERIAAAADALRAALSASAGQASPAWLLRLLPIPARRAGPAVLPVVQLLEEAAALAPDPWPILSALLASPSGQLQVRALHALADMVQTGRVPVTDEMALVLAERLEAENSPLAGEGVWTTVGGIIRRMETTTAGERDTDPCLHLFLEGETPAVRRMAARVLDLDGRPPGDDLVHLTLGADAAALLSPNLAFTRASHLDLIDVLPMARSESALESYRRAERVCGPRVMRAAVTALGWARLNAGIDVHSFIGVSLDGGFPLLLSPIEAGLFTGMRGARRVFTRFLVVAAGGRDLGRAEPSGAADAVARFRAYNVVHAEVLTEILDVAPLTRARLESVLEKVHRLVDDFAALFGASVDAPTREETAEVIRVHEELRARIAAVLARTQADPLPMELCRLVQPFEDPVNPGAVRTLHGLKRYLHQRGLKLALGLIGAGPRTTRTVDLAVVAPGGETVVARHIEFVDLEEGSDAGTRPPVLPYGVQLLVDAFSRQLLHGQRIPSHVRVFCYGNEVHYFARFRNHPAFVRIDYSPPLRGGMIDLQYAGVSNHDLDVHPCVTLDAIRLLFEHLDFIVTLDSTRIQARYDKERALALGQLHERAALLLHLVPYLMDIDWAIGSLPLGAEARGKVAAAWAEFFGRWGVLPYDQFMTRDRAGILTGRESGPTGVREVHWDGHGAYRDRFSVVPGDETLAALCERLARLDLEPASHLEIDDLRGQRALEMKVLEPLRRALARGEVEVTTAGLTRCDAARFERVHDVERLAAALESPPPDVARAAHLAQVIPLIERHVRFTTCGSVNGHEVQRARLSLGPAMLGLSVLRDGTGMARLACATEDECFWRRRDSEDTAWVESPACDVARVLDRLRAANVLGAAPDPLGLDDDHMAGELRRTFQVPRAGTRHRPYAGEHVAAATVASPGWAAGPARLGVRGRRPEDLHGAIFVAAGLDPRDAPCLTTAAAVVATGGGILSHLGLLAVEAGRPAVVLDARRGCRPNGEDIVVFPTLDYDEHERMQGGYRLVERHRVREVESEIRDGDIVVVDADHGTLTVLDGEPDAPSLHEALRQQVAALHRLERAGPDDELVERGHHLRARHQLERVLSRVSSPALVRFAVNTILLGPGWTDTARGARDGVEFLGRLAAGAATGEMARAAVAEVTGRLVARARDARDQATRLIPSCVTFHDVLALRAQAARLHDTLQRIAAALTDGGLDPGVVGEASQRDLDRLARTRLGVLRERFEADVLSDGPRRPGLRTIDELDRVDLVLGTPADVRARLDGCRQAWRAAGRAVADRLAGAGIVGPLDGGRDLEPLIGAKAANLAEVGRVLGGAFVPAWRAVTNRAFCAMLSAPVERAADGRAGAGRATHPDESLAETIEAIVRDASRPMAARAAAIRALWQRQSLPDALAAAIVTAYRELGTDAYIAMRSSGLDEDTAGATRAGQFDTFLFVRGEAAVLEHLKLVWSSLWTERALHERASCHDGRVPRMGVVMQRMVKSRVSGVLQTINAAEMRPCELVINAGLGLGEGIVSGAVAADHIVVSKDAGTDAPLRFRYLTADKRQRVVFDERLGHGTLRVDTLAHQRLRPTLEYPELVLLVGTALCLERAYGHPLDIEFGFDEADLRVLQARPVPAALAAWRDTMERFPLRPDPGREERLP